MTLSTWSLAMGLLLAAALSPLLLPHAEGRLYPMSLRILVGVALVVLAVAFPGTGGSILPGLMGLFVVGVAPIVVDGILDRPLPKGQASSLPSGGGYDDGSAMMATAALSAGLSATTSTTAW